MTFEPPNAPGFRFSDGKLRIFREHEIMVITGCPEPAAVTKSATNSRWRPFTPTFRLISPYRRTKSTAKRPRTKADTAPLEKDPDGQLTFDLPFAESPPPPAVAAPASGGEVPDKQPAPAMVRKRAFDAFRFAQPKDIAKALEPFRSHQWHLLVMLAHDPASLDLAKSNPALAYLLAQRLGADSELIRSLKCGTMSQRDLLACLDLPDSAAMVKLLRKVRPESITGDNWRAVAGLLRRGTTDLRQPLAHLPVINTGVIEIVSEARLLEAASACLLEEISTLRQEHYRAGVAQMLRDTLDMQEQLRGRDPVRLFADLERLRKVHLEVSAAHREYLRRRRAAALSGEAGNRDRAIFETPPIPGLPGSIEPLTSASHLVDEGEEQHNCVGSYAWKVRMGDTFIYRILKPERATLSIVRQSDGCWHISELLARYNEPVKASTERHVARWLDRWLIAG